MVAVKLVYRVLSQGPRQEITRFEDQSKIIMVVIFPRNLLTSNYKFDKFI